MRKKSKWFLALVVVLCLGAGTLTAWEWYARQEANLGGRPTPVQKGDSGGSSRSGSGPGSSTPGDAFAIRGVIEGFYGQPWSMAERIKMLEFMGRNNFNTYVYAPKNDPYQRSKWGELYPQAELQQLKQVVEAAQKNGIWFVYSISPGIPAPLPGQSLSAKMVADSITYTSAGDVGRLENKIAQLRAIGVHTFMLSFDDVEHTLKSADQRVYGSDYPRAQVELADKVLRDERRHDPSFRLWLAPTDYYGLKDSPYWRTIRSRLDSSVQVIWTGQWVLNKEINGSQAAQVGKLLGRKPLIWDNYPVNDYTYVVKKAPQLFMGPLENRSSGLSRQAAGLLANPMIQAEASKVALSTVGQYLINPAAYSPERAWDAALAARQGVGNAAAFRRFCLYSSRSLLNDSGNPDFLRLVSAYWQDYRAGKRGASETNLKQELEAVSQLPQTLAQTMTNKELLTEIEPWLIKLGQEGQAGLLALDYLDLPAKDPAKTGAKKQLEESVQKLTANNLRIGPEILEFAQAALHSGPS
ncbi:O-GlcNAcase NagJ precursor [Peptococcaceae bacterium CEB3]|nr:O-GlcNAcase NagJ precursor [Peptococcaceae bacterium CEB3]